MNKKFFVALFTVAVLLGGTMSYTATMYMLPTADADGPEYNAELCMDCAMTLGEALNECIDGFEGSDPIGDKEIDGLSDCVEDANEAYNECLEDTCELD